MKPTANKAKRMMRLLLVLLGMALTMPAAGPALQTSVPSPSSAQRPMIANAPNFAKASVRWVLVSIHDRKLALLENGKVVRIYRVAVGKNPTPSPVGAFQVVNRVSNPTYYHKGQIIAAGNGNPVGSRWIGLSARGYGIHGTNQPNSIGKAASTGCIRMSKRDLEELFEMVNVGDRVEIEAERDDQIATVFRAGAPERMAQARNDAGNAAAE